MSINYIKQTRLIIAYDSVKHDLTVNLSSIGNDFAIVATCEECFNSKTAVLLLALTTKMHSNFGEFHFPGSF